MLLEKDKKKATNRQKQYIRKRDGNEKNAWLTSFTNLSTCSGFAVLLIFSLIDTIDDPELFRAVSPGSRTCSPAEAAARTEPSEPKKRHPLHASCITDTSRKVGDLIRELSHRQFKSALNAVLVARLACHILNSSDGIRPGRLEEGETQGKRTEKRNRAQGRRAKGRNRRSAAYIKAQCGAFASPEAQRHRCVGSWHNDTSASAMAEIVVNSLLK
ncbi:hypothetical protein B7463_g2409, partial [Scytalidium lignicola]